MSGSKMPPPPVPESPAGPKVPDEGIDLFGDDDDERTEIAQPGDTGAAITTPVKPPDDGGISLDDDDDDDRTTIEKKPGPPR